MTETEKQAIVEWVVNRIYSKHFRHADGHELQKILDAANHFELWESYIWERQTRIEVEARHTELRAAAERALEELRDWRAQRYNYDGEVERALEEVLIGAHERPAYPRKDCANIGCDCCANCGGVNSKAEGAQYWALGLDWIKEALEPQEKEEHEDEI